MGKRMTLFRVAFDVHFTGVAEWSPEERNVLAYHGDDAVTRARRLVLKAGWEEKKRWTTIQHTATEARLVGCTKIAQADA